MKEALRALRRIVVRCNDDYCCGLGPICDRHRWLGNHCCCCVARRAIARLEGK